jgi:hypothetical protein
LPREDSQGFEKKKKKKVSARFEFRAKKLREFKLHHTARQNFSIHDWRVTNYERLLKKRKKGAARARNI